MKNRYALLLCVNQRIIMDSNDDKINRQSSDTEVESEKQSG